MHEKEVNKTKNWYEISIENEIIKALEIYLLENTLLGQDKIKSILNENIINLMDEKFVKDNYSNCLNVEEFNKVLKHSYLLFRNSKYGTQNFWEFAKEEREKGYNYKWHDYINNIFQKYCKVGDNILFIGTANGYEIPKQEVKYKFYAMDEIQNSIEALQRIDIKEKIVGSFEDVNLKACEYKMDALVALRCLLGKSNLKKFFQFVDNNLRKNGIIIASQPIKYLKEEELIFINRYKTSDENFRYKLEKAKKEFKFEVIDTWTSDIEKFYIIKWLGKNEKSIIN